MTGIDALLGEASRRIGAREARLLLGHLLDRNAAWLEAHRDDAVDAAIATRYSALVARRACGEPVAYLTGRREFYGRDFHVAPGVLIPRPETELIVDRVLREASPPSRILDLGTGSGCLAVTLALELPRAKVTAVDISPDALAIARRNAQALGARLRLVQSDWFVALGSERHDMIVANPPYIAVGDPHLAQGDLRFEPAGALASGADGLDAIRHIVARAGEHLNPGGLLLFEHGYDQADAVRALLLAHGYREVEQLRDLAGIIRVSGGRR